MLPRSRLIAILRQPAERAYSDYLFKRERNMEPAGTFEEALAQETERLNQGWHSGLFYKANGFYYTQLSAYYNLFRPEQIKVYLYEDWKNAPQATLRDLFRFLQVDENFAPEIQRRNVTWSHKSPRLHRLANDPTEIERLAVLPALARRLVVSVLKRIDRRFNLAAPPPLDQQIRVRLTADYREDILKLQDLIGRDLSHWLNT